MQAVALRAENLFLNNPWDKIRVLRMLLRSDDIILSLTLTALLSVCLIWFIPVFL